MLCLAVSSGSVSVHADSTVQVLAEEAVTMDMLDLAVSTQRLHQPWGEIVPLLCPGVLLLGASCAQNPGLCLHPYYILGSEAWGSSLVSSQERGSSAVANLHTISHPLDRH